MNIRTNIFIKVLTNVELFVHDLYDTIKEDDAAYVKIILIRHGAITKRRASLYL